ncbi:MAG: amidohydrolase family protein [Candidatus Bathyarchaeia archaeon]
MIIDAHTHLGAFPDFNVELDAEGLISLMDECDVEHSVVFSLPNRLTYDAIKEYPGRLSGLVWVNPLQGEAAEDEVRKAINGWGFKGIKMHPLLDSYLPDSEAVDPIMELARKYETPVLFHSGHPPWSLPWHFGNLAQRFPDVKIILGHMGHGHIVYINGSIDVAMKHENIYLETSGMPMHTKIKEAVEKVGVNRALYGSDAPFGHQAFEIKKVEVSGLNSPEISKVLGENALTLFKLDI